MSGGRASGRAGRSAAGRTLLSLVVLLPALLLGQALGRTTAWIHAHGPSGEHLHLLPEQLEQQHLGTLHALHDAQHGHEHEHEDGRDEGDEPATPGLLIGLPHILAVARDGPSHVSAPGVLLPALQPPTRGHVAFAEGMQRRARCRLGWPPEEAQPSGVVALLRSSHAILI